MDMNNDSQLEEKNFLLKMPCKASRDPHDQHFDNYDFENGFSNLKIIDMYRKKGEKVMQQHFDS